MIDLNGILNLKKQGKSLLDTLGGSFSSGVKQVEKTASDVSSGLSSALSSGFKTASDLIKTKVSDPKMASRPGLSEIFSSIPKDINSGIQATKKGVEDISRVGKAALAGFTTVPGADFSPKESGFTPKNQFESAAAFVGSLATPIPGIDIPGGGAAARLDKGAAKLVKEIDKPGVANGIKRAMEKVLDTGVVANARSTFDRIFTDSRSVLERSPAGKELAKTLDKVFDNYQKIEGQAISSFKSAFKNVSDETFSKILDYREGVLNGDVAPEIKAGADQLGKLLDNFATLAKKAKLEIRLPDDTVIPWQPLKNYVPQVLDQDKLKLMQEEVVSFLTKTVQPGIKRAMRENEAIATVKGLLEEKDIKDIMGTLFPSSFPKLQGNLEFTRVLKLPTEVLKRDKELILGYINAASKRIAQAQELGSVNQNLDRMLLKVGSEVRDVKLIKEVTMRELGLEAKDIGAEKTVGLLRSLQSFGKLGTAAISNLTQSVNTATAYGIRRTIGSIVGVTSKVNREFAEKAGVVTESALRDITEQSLGSKAMGQLIAPGFRQVEAFNRSVAANAGKMWAIDTFEKVLKGDVQAKHDLSKMGVAVEEAIKKGSLTANDLINAGRKAVSRTQFTVRPLDLPASFTSTYGKLIFQFKNFAFKQGKFIGDEVLGPALKGNLAPLIRYSLLGVIVGEASSDIKATISGRERPGLDETVDILGAKVPKRVLENISAVGGAGLLADLYDAATRGRDSLLRWVAGPTGGDIASITSGVVRGDPKELGRTATGFIPVVGPRVKKELYPSGAKSKGQINKSFEFPFLKSKETKTPFKAFSPR